MSHHLRYEAINSTTQKLCCEPVPSHYSSSTEKLAKRPKNAKPRKPQASLNYLFYQNKCSAVKKKT